jgi:hypothetical protein
VNIDVNAIYFGSVMTMAKSFVDLERYSCSVMSSCLEYIFGYFF